MHPIQEKIKEETIYDNGKKKVLLKTFRTSDGTVKEIPILSNKKSKYATITLVLDKHLNIYYGKEYRDGPEDFVHNFSAGKHEEGLTFKDNAIKELKEELGVTSCDITYLGETFVAAYDTSIMKYFIAKNCKFGQQYLEKGENFEIQSCSLKDFEKKIIEGDINCSQSLTCFTLAKIKGYL